VETIYQSGGQEQKQQLINAAYYLSQLVGSFYISQDGSRTTHTHIYIYVTYIILSALSHIYRILFADELFSSSWCNIQAPKVEVLVLNFQTKNYSLPEFVEKMDKLKVLIITNYGFFPAELRNFQLLGSLPNLKRIRLEKVSIPSLCKTPVPLKSLKKISLFMCNIGQGFWELYYPSFRCIAKSNGDKH
jgi:hypothetical protein